MVNHFDRNSITEWFWKIIHEADGDPDKLKAALEQLSRYEVNLFFREFRAEAEQVIFDCYEPNHKPRYSDNIRSFGDVIYEVMGEKCFDKREMFYPDACITDWSWDIIKRAEKSKEKLRIILKELTLSEIYIFQKEFTDASVSLRDDPFLLYTDESEDGVQDITWWLVSQGKESYYSVWENPQLFPNTVEGKGSEILYGIATDVYEEKGGNFHDLPYS